MKFFFILIIAPVLVCSCLKKNNVKTKSQEADRSVSFDTVSINRLKSVGENIVRHRVTVINNTSSTIHFSFGESTSRLDTFSISPQQQWISPYSKVNPTVKIKSGKKNSISKLQLGKKYSLFFNEAKKTYDTREVSDSKK